jgi:hypothetical protein
MIFSIFDVESKIIIGHLTCVESDVELITSNRSDIIEGYYKPGKYRVDQGQIVAIVESVDPQIEIASHLRKFRNESLSAVDRISPVWYASLTADQQTELAAYRQALLDVPQQMGFPTAVSWPAKPAWL